MVTTRRPGSSLPVRTSLHPLTYCCELQTDTRVIWGLNFGQNNITASFLEARSIVKAFSSPEIKRAGIVLDAIEIGNEADFYGDGRRPSPWTSTEYIKG